MSRTIAVLCLLLFSVLCFEAIASTGAVACGTMELVCIPPIGLDMHLMGFPKHETLTIHLWATPVKVLEKNKPLPVTATWCTAPEKCENGDGTVEFEHLNLAKKASGNYNLRFSNTREEKGTFTVQSRQQSKPFVCE